ncbi:SMC family ATPase [Glutamicibacter sp.]|uniref:SMC family ATPase n=1 Tax=Glutamicibacter sp. TaxID=1931995 RepID=UPI0028BDDE79|nr:SMC family ATPase [Glutamicibacter sp.]
MRIHQLQIQAFGPFARTEVINFDELAEAGLFLLDGPTGAGKSSILDAICYALYGSLPGNRTGSRQIRSDHAAPGAEPQVICELSIGDRRFEVTRSPAWMRPSKRGKNKTTEQKAASHLREWVGGAWEELSTRNDEVGQILGGLLGLDRDQFTKVVMLPQGGFADFLRAKAKDREDLLANLFDTSDYAAIEEEFAARLSAERKLTESLEAELSASENVIRHDATGFLAEHEQVDVTQSVEASDSILGVEEEFSAYEQRLGVCVQRYTGVAENAKNTLNTARELVKQLEERVRVFDLLTQLKVKEELHEQRHPGAVDAAARLEKDAKAASVRAYLAQLKSAEELLEAAEQEFTAAQVRLKEEQDFGLVNSEGSLSKLAQLVKDHEAELTIATSALQEEQGRAQLAKDLEAATTDLKVKAERENSAQDKLAKLREERSSLETGDTDQQRADATVQELKTGQLNVQTQLEQAKNRDKLEGTVAKAEQLYAAQALTVVEAEKALLALQRTQLEQSALRLAAALEVGSACMVCGATEHPSPARADAEAQLIDDEQIEQLNSTVTRERALLTQVGNQREAAATKLEAASQAAAGGSVEELQVQLETVAEKLKTAEHHSAAVTALNKKIDHLRTVVEKESSAHAQLVIEVAAADTAVKTLEAKLEELDQKLQALCGEHESLDKKVASLQERAASFTLGHRALHRYREAAKSALEAQERWDDERMNAGFADAAAFAEAVLADEARSELRALVQEDIERAGAIASLRSSTDYQRGVDLAAQGVGTPSEEDLGQASDSLSAADAGYDRARRLQVQAQSQLQRHNSSVRQLENQRAEAGPKIEAYRRLRALAEVIRGGGENLYKMTLSTYVLAARLEEVAVAATERLKVMSGDRYSLHHDDSKQGNSKSGLGLTVLDAWTGRYRETQTLSGGETFMASLSLALGLADVISHHSGAVDMQTLFVDEGFGSLDAETLEQVMTALENLRAGGRTIGLVSHVAEMKQRITNRVSVVKTQNGSSIQRELKPLIAL